MCIRDRPGHVAALKETDEDILADMEHKNVFIGLIDDEPVGSIRYEVHNGVAYISRFGVINSARHAGMGGNLIETVVRDCRRKGIPAIPVSYTHLTAASRRFG